MQKEKKSEYIASPKLWLLYKLKLEVLNFNMLLTFLAGWLVVMGYG